MTASGMRTNQRVERRNEVAALRIRRLAGVLRDTAPTAPAANRPDDRRSSTARANSGRRNAAHAGRPDAVASG